VEAGSPPLRCDGCGAAANETHIRRRIERLELATRFRPIHIQVLFLDLAPPARLEDFFYRPTANPSERSVASRMWFEEMICGARIAKDSWKDEQAALTEFQRRNLFLAYAVECPLEEIGAGYESDASGAIAKGVARQYGETVLKRVQFSYKPKHVALLNYGTADLIPLFQQAGCGDRLLLDRGAPVTDPFLGDPASQAEFGTGFGARIAQLLAKLP
jgi:hypothetical protein